MDTWYVMLEGSTQEEERSEAELELLVETGAFHGGNLVYLPEQNQWVKASDSPIRHLFATDDGPALATAAKISGEDERTPHEMLEDEFRSLREQLDESPGALDICVRLAEISAQLGDKIMAKKVLRDALNLSPYNSKVAALAKRLLSPEERKHIPYLERTPPFWKDLGGLLGYPLLDKGVIHILITGTILYVTSFIPVVGAIFAGLVYFYLLEVIRSSGSGRGAPPNWDFDIPNIFALVLKPAVPTLIVLIEVSGPFVLLAWLAAEGDGFMRFVNMMAWVAQNPPFLVLWALVSLVYYPAVLMIIAISDENIADAINPLKVIVSMRVMKEDYMMAIVFLGVFMLMIGVGTFILGWIPLVGPWIAQCLVFYALMITGRVLGLTYRRHMHCFI